MRVGLCVALLVACGGDADEADLSDASGGAFASDASAGVRDATATTAAEAGLLDASPGLEAGTSSDAQAPESGAAALDAAPADARDAASDAGPPADAGGCSFAGHISYTLARAAAPSADQSSAYALITAAMDGAVAKYNCYTDITRSLRVSYEPNVATADGNVNGSIRFGARANMTLVAAMHEISHVLGVGSNEFRAKVQSGTFNGARATAQLREISGKPDDVVHSDGTHFWPNGLNYPNEYKSEADAVNHCKMVIAIRVDLGL